MDPSGDVVLTLRNPNELFAPCPQLSTLATTESPAALDSNTNGSKTDASTKLVTFRISSRHLILASPVFKALLTGGWKEGEPTSKGEYHITAEGWDVGAMVIFLDILHGRNMRVPKTVTLELLAKLAVIVDYYAAHEAMYLLYPRWIEDLRRPPGAIDSLRDITMRVCITWVFSDEPNFITAVRAAVQHASTNLMTGDLPIPETVVSKPRLSTS